MKIESRNSTIQLDAVRAAKQKEVKQAEEAKGAKVGSGDSVNTQLSQALSNVLEGISESGLSAGEIHSNVSPQVVDHLLSEAPIAVSKPQIPADILLAFTDKVASMMVQDPQASLKAFSAIDPNRALELI